MTKGFTLFVNHPHTTSASWIHYRLVLTKSLTCPRLLMRAMLRVGGGLVASMARRMAGKNRSLMAFTVPSLCCHARFMVGVPSRNSHVQTATWRSFSSGSPDGGGKSDYARKQNHVTEVVRLDKDFCFIVIGNKRENLMRISKTTKTIIYINNRSDGAERMVEIRGAPENVEKAKEMILDSIKGVLKMTVAKSVLPFVIGKGGVNIRKLSQDTGVKVRTFDIDAESLDGELILYGAPAENIQMAKKRIEEIIGSKAGAGMVGKKQGLQKEIFDVSNSEASAIIGRVILVDLRPGQEDADGNAQREIIIVGDSKSVQAAKAVVTDIMADTQSKKEAGSDHTPKSALARLPRIGQRNEPEHSMYLCPDENQTEAIECHISTVKAKTFPPPQEDAFTVLDSDAEIQRLKDQGHKVDEEWVEIGREIANALNLNPTFTYHRKRSLFRLAMKTMNAEDPMYYVTPFKIPEETELATGTKAK
eukprot:766764-Hanusia_phi.AAC.9